MTKKKLIYLDVGTHYGQEYMALVGHSYITLCYKFIKIKLAKIFLKKKSIHSINLNEAIKILKSLKIIRKNKQNIYSILVEPNVRLIGSKVYSLADKVFCIGLGDDDLQYSFHKLFFPDSYKESQGASIYQTKSNINLKDSDLIIVVGSSEFAKQLKHDLDNRFGHDKYELVIRLNCEGAEDSIVYAFKDIFKGQFNFLLGSLKDVGELKGEQKLDDLNKYLKEKKINFTYFSPLYTSWADSFAVISKLLTRL